MNDNFVAIFEALPLGLAHAHKLARNGFVAAFLPQAEKDAFLAPSMRISPSTRHTKLHIKTRRHAPAFSLNMTGRD